MLNRGKNNNKKYFNICIISNIIGIIIGIWMLSVGLQHNVQGEFINTETGKIDYIYSFFVFFSWYVVFVLIGCVIRILLNFLKSNKI